jgi:large subunit ribosomal protein L24
MAAAEWLPVSAVRLVHPVTDYATNTTRDVIIKQLIPVNKYLDRPTGKREWDRLVPGLNITIPWPRKEDPKHEDHPSDTLRIDAEAKTFVPTLLRPPMPVAVLDELRGKYSRFRTRHTDEYVAQKEADEALKERRKSKAGVHPSMMTPLQELNRRLRADSKALGQPELGDEMLERIGRVIARNIGMYEEGEAAERQRAVARREREEAERRREIVERHRRNSEPAMGDLQIAEAIREPRDPAAPS